MSSKEFHPQLAYVLESDPTLHTFRKLLNEEKFQEIVDELWKCPPHITALLMHALSENKYKVRIVNGLLDKFLDERLDYRGI